MDEKKLTDDLKCNSYKTSWKAKFFKANAEIERLKAREMIADLEIERLEKRNGMLLCEKDAMEAQCIGFQNQVDELTEENGWLEGYNSGLKYENAELQKQVDELTAFKNEAISMSLYGKGRKDGEKIAVKDTAKEIFMEILSRMKKLKDMFESPFGDYRESKEHLVATIDIEIMGIKNLAKQYGVEVE